MQAATDKHMLSLAALDNNRLLKTLFTIFKVGANSSYIRRW